MSLFMRALMLVLLGLVVLFLVWPAPFRAVAWQPDRLQVPPENHALQAAVLWAQGQIIGPEDVEIDASGHVYAGLADGRIVRVEGDHVETIARTGGRPLGLVLDGRGHLVVCDAYRGLLQVDLSGQVRVLTDRADGVPFGFTDDLDRAADGKIYFTDASWRWSQRDYLLDMLEGRPYGRLLVYDPATKTTRTLLKDLYFANGVAVMPDGQSELVAETWRYRITRYWLKGTHAGQHEVFADNLPGMPDNIDVDSQGHVWVALPTPRRPDIDFLARHTWLRERMAVLPRFMWPGPSHQGWVLELDSKGHTLRSLQDPSGNHLRFITSAHRRHGQLVLGSLENDRIGVLNLTP